MEDMERHRDQATVAGGQVGIMPRTPAAQAGDSAARTLEQLRWTYTDHNADFGRVAALEQPGVEVRDAVKAVLGLPPDVLAALGAVTALSEEDRRTISAAIGLPAEVQATLRTILG
jgi:hypothetical protein